MTTTMPAANTARDPRNGLRIAAASATLFTIVGHAFFGFEQSLAHIFTAIGTAYVCALLFEAVDARANGRPPGFAGGGLLKVIDFLVSAHMTSITMSFLIYTNSHFCALAFAVAAAIGSKFLFRIEVGGKVRHFMNPSNFGLVTTMLIFQWTCVIPWSLTTELHGFAAWFLPVFIAVLGFRLNLLYTHKLPLISSFLVGFVIQGIVRSYLLGNPVAAELAFLTNAPLAIFTMYMITDPQTSPSEARGQIAYGLAIAACYGLLLAFRINYAIFLCVTIAAAGRGLVLYVTSLQERGLLFAKRFEEPAVAIRAGMAH